jgi:hypothetical protein
MNILYPCIGIYASPGIFLVAIPKLTTKGHKGTQRGRIQEEKAGFRPFFFILYFLGVPLCPFVVKFLLNQGLQYSGIQGRKKAVYSL